MVAELRAAQTPSEGDFMGVLDDPVIGSREFTDLELLPGRGVMHGRNKAPRAEIQKEQPWHRQMAFMLAHGMTQKQVAAALDKSIVSVNLAFQQPFVQQQVLDIIASERSTDGAKALLAGAVNAAALSLIRIAAGGLGANANTQLKANLEILNRVLGPTGKEKIQPDNNSAQSASELEEINKQIEQLEKQQQIL